MDPEYNLEAICDRYNHNLERNAHQDILDIFDGDCNRFSEFKRKFIIIRNYGSFSFSKSR